MGFEVVRVPLGSDGGPAVGVAFLVKGTNAGPFAHIQRARDGSLSGLAVPLDQTGSDAGYRVQAIRLAPTLAEQLPLKTFDAIVSPPSDFTHAEPFRLFLANRARVDLTGRFSRCSGGPRSGEGADQDQIARAMAYQPHGDEDCIQSLLIVDESFHTGSTAASLIQRLREHGLPESCQHFLACAFWSLGEK